MLLQRVVDKEELVNKVHTKIEALQKEIKDMYALFKPLMEKGLPYLWDDQNRLLKKEQYENLIVAKRNDHSQFDDLQGNLRGEVLVVNLGDIFYLLNLEKRIKFSQPRGRGIYKSWTVGHPDEGSHVAKQKSV